MQALLQAGDKYTDLQYSSFVLTVSTVYIYLITGDNYQDSATFPMSAVSCSLWCKIVFFIFTFALLFLGVFFIAAVLIEVLNAAFLKGKSLTLERRQKQVAP